MSVTQIAAKAFTVEVSLESNARQFQDNSFFAELMADRAEPPPVAEKADPPPRAVKQGREKPTEEAPETPSEAVPPSVVPFPEPVPTRLDVKAEKSGQVEKNGKAVTGVDVDGQRPGPTEFMKNLKQMLQALKQEGMGASDHPLSHEMRQLLERVGIQTRTAEGGTLPWNEIFSQLQGFSPADDQNQNAFLFNGFLKNPMTAQRISAGAGSGSGARFPRYVLDQVTRQIAHAHQRGDNDIRLQLKPATLGRLQMHISTRDDGLRVSIIAEQSAARDLILSQVNELKSMLAAQGLNLDAVSVEISRQFGQSLTDAGTGFKGGRNRGKSTGNVPAGQAAPPGTVDPTQTARRRGATLYLVA